MTVSTLQQALPGSALVVAIDPGKVAHRPGRSVARWHAIRADIAAAEIGIEALLAGTAGQVLTTAIASGFTRKPKASPARRCAPYPTPQGLHRS